MFQKTMSSLALALTLMMLTVTSAAKAAEQDIEGVWNTRFQLPSEYSDLSIDEISVAEVPSRVTEESCEIQNQNREALCPPARTIQTTRVVQVGAHYWDLTDNHQDSRSYSGDSRIPVFFVVNFPLDAFSEKEIAEIQKASDFFFDFFGDKARALKALAHRLIALEATSSMLPIEVIDYSKSECVRRDNPAQGTIEEECSKIVYQTLFRKQNSVQFSRKQARFS